MLYNLLIHEFLHKRFRITIEYLLVYLLCVSSGFQCLASTENTHITLFSASPKGIRDKTTWWLFINRKYINSTTNALNHVMNCSVYSLWWLWSLVLTRSVDSSLNWSTGKWLTIISITDSSSQGKGLCVFLCYVILIECIWALGCWPDKKKHFF